MSHSALRHNSLVEPLDFLGRYWMGVTFPSSARPLERSSLSVTPTRSDDHIPVFLQNDIGIVIKVKNRYRVKFCGSTAWFRHILRIHKMNLFKESDIKLHVSFVTSPKWITFLAGPSEKIKAPFRDFFPIASSSLRF